MKTFLAIVRNSNNLMFWRKAQISSSDESLRTFFSCSSDSQMYAIFCQWVHEWVGYLYPEQNSEKYDRVFLFIFNWFNSPGWKWGSQWFGTSTSEYCTSNWRSRRQRPALGNGWPQPVVGRGWGRLSTNGTVWKWTVHSKECSPKISHTLLLKYYSYHVLFSLVSPLAKVRTRHNVRIETHPFRSE